MSNLSHMIQEFAQASGVDTARWAVTDTERSLLIGNIASRVQADSLQAFLVGRGMVCTLSMGDRRGTTWSLVARLPVAGPVEDEE
jgi:hypothetical protein